MALHDTGRDAVNVREEITIDQPSADGVIEVRDDSYFHAEKFYNATY